MSKIKVHIGESLKDWLESNGEYEKFEHLMNTEVYDILSDIFSCCGPDDDVYDLCFCNDTDLASIADYLQHPIEPILAACAPANTVEVTWVYCKYNGKWVIVMYIPKYRPTQNMNGLTRIFNELFEESYRRHILR